MTTTHTQGPWKATTDFINIYAEDGRCIASLDSEASPCIGLEETQANARLIVESPALAEALAWALAQIEDDLDPDHQAALEAAKATLARATGGAA